MAGNEIGVKGEAGCGPRYCLACRFDESRAVVRREQIGERVVCFGHHALAHQHLLPGERGEEIAVLLDDAASLAPQRDALCEAVGQRGKDKNRQPENVIPGIARSDSPRRGPKLCA